MRAAGPAAEMHATSRLAGGAPLPPPCPAGRSAHLRCCARVASCRVVCSIIAMAYPSTGYESIYRNPITEVSRFLHTHHGDNFMVFNLSER